MRTIAQITLLPYAIALTGALAPVPVVATGADESSPSTNGTDLAWTKGSAKSPVVKLRLGTVYLNGKAITGPGVRAASGGMDRQTLVVSLVRDNQADLVLYDVTRHTYSEPPEGVNTRDWEWRGAVSGRWLLFGRVSVAGNGSAYDIALADLATGETRVLDRVDTHAAYAEPGQIEGRYAVWSRCSENLCVVYRYDVLTRKRVRVDGDYRQAAVAPSVTPKGVVYYAKGRYTCGAVHIVRWQAGHGRTTVATLPSGYDLRFTDTDGKMVFFDRVRCPDRGWDVYRVRVAR
jgi:hypothetical protein